MACLLALEASGTLKGDNTCTLYPAFAYKGGPERPPRMRCSQVRSLATFLRRSSVRRRRSYSVN